MAAELCNELSIRRRYLSVCSPNVGLEAVSAIEAVAPVQAVAAIEAVSPVQAVAAIEAVTARGLHKRFPS